MISLEVAKLIKVLVSSFIGYIPVLTFVGVMSTWLASKLGDSTAEDEGLMSFNPLIHVNFFGLAMFLVPPLHIGFIQSTPIDPENIKGSYKEEKQLALFFVNFISSFMSLVISLFFVIVFLGFFSKTMLSSTRDLPPFAYSMLLILRSMVNASGFALIINLVYGFFKSIFFFYFPEHRYSFNYFYAHFVIPLLILLLFGKYFNMLFNFLVLVISAFFHHILN